jgi:hypothetical protein
MAAGAAGRDEVGVEVEVDRAGDVARVVGGTAGSGRLAQIPADVDDPKAGPALTNPVEERLGRNERGLHVESMPASLAD